MDRDDLVRHADATQLLQPHMNIDASLWLQDGRRTDSRYRLTVPTPKAYRRTSCGAVSYRYGDLLDTIQALSRAYRSHYLAAAGHCASKPLSWDVSSPKITAEVIAGVPGISIALGGHTVRLKGSDAKMLGYELVGALVDAKRAASVTAALP